MLSLETTARQQPGPAAEVAVMRQRQLIGAQVALVGTTVASLAAELDCEGERADQAASYLKAQDDRRTQRLNVLFISIGATSGIGTTVVNNKATQYTFGISGGLLTAGLGLLTLTGDHSTEFTHPRNLLADVWSEKPASDVFPPGVWYLLTEPAFSDLCRRDLCRRDLCRRDLCRRDLCRRDLCRRKRVTQSFFHESYLRHSLKW